VPPPSPTPIFATLTAAAKWRHTEARPPAAVYRAVGLVVVDAESDAHASIVVAPSDRDDATGQDDRE
jgi:hypothetical protein